VGDEDLLEIIGNSKNVARLQKHFKKMFAGVAAILLNEDNTVITGIASREGEEVEMIYINYDDFSMFSYKLYINFELRCFL
jgi:Dynein heavy chain, N-terminal region 2.